MRKIIFFIYLVLGFRLFAGDLTINSVNSYSGHIESDATITQANLYPSTVQGFFDTDANTVMHFKGFIGTNTFTAVSGSGYASLTFNLTDSNVTFSTASETVTMDSESIEMAVATFGPTNCYIQNSDSTASILPQLTDYTIEFIAKRTNGAFQADYLFANAIFSPSNGMYLILADNGGNDEWTLTDFDNGSTRINITVNNSESLDNTWFHVAVTFDSGTGTIKVAYKKSGLITAMTTSGVGNDIMVSSTGMSNSYTAAPEAINLGPSSSNHAVGNRSWNSKVAEWRISDVVRY